MPEEKNNLEGAKEICERFGWTEHKFNIYLRLGLPCARINGRIVAHFKNVDAWWQELTKGGEYDDVSEDEVNGGGK